MYVCIQSDLTDYIVIIKIIFCFVLFAVLVGSLLWVIFPCGSKRLKNTDITPKFYKHVHFTVCVKTEVSNEEVSFKNEKDRKKKKDL